MKAKKRFVCSKKQKSDKRSVTVKGKWKAVELDPGLFSEEGLEGLICFEELTNYSLIDTEKAAATAAKELKHREKKANKRKASEEEETGDECTTEPAKKKPKKKKKNKGSTKKADSDSPEEAKQENKASDEEVDKDALGDLTSVSDLKAKSKVKNKKKKNKSKKQTEKSAEPEKQLIVELPLEQTIPDGEKSSQGEISKPPMKQVKNWTNAALCSSDDKNADVSAWKDLFVPPLVLKALSSLGFTSPTPIQALALPSAIRDRMDVLGAAETGSGKTLAFGIPMIHSILEWQSGPEKTVAGDCEPSERVESLYLPSVNKLSADTELEDEMEASNEEDRDDNNQIQEEEEEREQDELLDSSSAVCCSKEKDAGDQTQPLLGLVLTPTRELAVQVKHHIDAIAKFTGIKTAIVVGGMAQQKQRRMLKRRPEVVIATPGRLWDLIKEKDPHLVNLKHVRCLVIDEADRMVERGHFAELENLLEMLNTTHFNPTRQMFVFSATLTMTHSLPSRLMKKKKSIDQRNKLEVLMEKVGIKSKPKVIDLTRKEATVETLTETQIHCQKEEKDFYLYYFLLQYPGRTMVFANSIDCIKRLNSLLVILDCTPLPLHANMHQKQRLKNLERFAERESCVLLTTDVAARGLDIPDVQHVIHYQIPRTSETYVHRSGRTARATKEGLSLLLISPDDMMSFQKIYKTLGKDEELPMFPVETKCMKAIEERVKVAHSIEKLEYFNSREKKHNSWLRRAAEELELDLDEDLLLGGGKDDDDDREQKKKVKGMKKHLKYLISQPIFKSMLKTKYPTQMGKLPLPNIPLSKKESALTSVSKDGRKKKFKKNAKPQQRKQDKQ